ncbi:aspartate/glutamate racemase family protein [Arabiibacter massiliensis]|uniref:aspartate/glutamate racemase family protein n=1 Tax=Arabiibacter massiliensis TaxID=1870985 RepID=UPI0009B99AE3|nr:aspartate/glutamate racemase family protein [Arabiibacter massiliensis]
MDELAVGIIRVITQEQERVEAHGRLIERMFPQVRAVSRCIPDQPEGVHDAATKRAAVPKVVALARELEASGVDGIVVSCADDPGVAEARAVAGVPVVGAGESMAAAAAALADGPVGVIGITPDAPEAFARILGERLLANVVPEGVRDTRDLLGAAGQAAALDAARDLRDAGAAVIALACTGFSTINLAPALQQAAGIPVLDPVTCEAEALLRVMSGCLWQDFSAVAERAARRENRPGETSRDTRKRRP